MSNAIGIIELSSIAAGYQAHDAMLKAADVETIIARTICSGKFLVVMGGSVSAITAALEAGKDVAGGFVIEVLNIPNIDSQVFAALSGTVQLPQGHNRAMGIVETFSATPIIEAADAAVKTASVQLYRVHVSMAIGGKGFFLLNGDVGAVESAIASAKEVIKESGMLVNTVIIPSASPELFRDYV